MIDPRPSVLVIGAGMYVGGRGAGTDGTVLPALMQAKEEGLIGKISVAATSSGSIDTLQTKLNELNSRMGTQVKINGYPTVAVHDPQAYRQALADMPKPGCCIVVVPDHLHAEITSDVIKAGVHPLVVKPLTPTLQEALDLEELAEKHKVHAAVEFHKRWDESNILLRQAIADGKLGELRYITVEYSQRRMMRDVFGTWLDRTNIFQYLGVHYIDLVYYLTGAQPIRALAVGQPAQSGSDQGPGGDSIQTLIEWELPDTKSRMVSSIVASWIDPDNTSAMSDQGITVVGTEGRYDVDQKHRGAQLVTQKGGVEDVNPYFSQIYRDPDGKFGVNGYGPKSIIQFLKDVIDVEAGRRTRHDLISNRPSFQDCFVSTAVTEAINISLALNGEWVAMKDLPASIPTVGVL